MEDLASPSPPSSSLLHPRCSHKHSPHCGTVMAHSRDFAQTSWRTGIISTQHSVNIHWENVLQFIAAVPQLLSTGLGCRSSTRAHRSWTSHLVTVRKEAMCGKGACSAPIIHYSCPPQSYFYSGSQRGWSHLHLMSAHDSFSHRKVFEDL